MELAATTLCTRLEPQLLDAAEECNGHAVVSQAGAVLLMETVRKSGVGAA